MADQRNIDVKQSADGSALVSGDHNRIDQSRTVNNVVNNYYGPLPNQPPSQRTDRNEKTLLSAVWAEVQDRLNQSLHNAVLLNLGKAEQRHQVSRPWDSQLRIADQASRPLDPETAIAEVFDREDINGRLLILGNPGAGKTTTLLDLAAALVQRANGDPAQPIPVMFNLSSWQDDKQTLKDWLLSELKLKYGVSTKLGQQWLEAQTLLPLLDGLDELPPHRQEPAVQKINDWLQSGEGASQLLVCSRREEYELYATKLLLNGAICLEPLTDDQLATYFAALGMEPLWHTVRQDPDFLALVRTPLLLSVSILANDNIDPAQWQRLNTPQERLDYLLDAYIQRQLHTPIASRTYPPHKQPTPQQTRHWLTWLAQQLHAQSEDEFLIEKMQPRILEKDSQKNIYGFIVGSIIGFYSGLILTSLIRFSIDSNDIFIFIPIFTIFFGCIFSFMQINNLVNMELKTAEELAISLSKITITEALRGTIQGLLIALLLWMILSDSSSHLPLIPFLYLFGIGFAFIFGFAGSVKSYEIKTKLSPNQGIFYSLKNVSILILSLGLWIALLFPVLMIFPSFYLDDYAEYIVSFLLVLLMFVAFSSGGGIACTQHLALRVALQQTNCVPWNYARFLNHCTERLLLQRVGGRYRFIHRLVQERFAVTGGHRLWHHPGHGRSTRRPPHSG